MKRYFLVDYETVQNLDGIENLTETDVVILLFMDDTKGVSFRTLAKMQQSRAEIQQRLINGNQETDMCYAIAFLAGQISAKDDEIVLIARSNDFSLFLKTFTEDASIKLSDYESIEKFLENEPKQEKKPEIPVPQAIDEKSTKQAGKTKKSTISTKRVGQFTPKEETAVQKVFKQIYNGFAPSGYEKLFRELFWTAIYQPQELSEKVKIIAKEIGYSESTLLVYIQWYRNMLN